MKTRMSVALLSLVTLLPALSFAAPTSKGISGLFEMVTAETLPRGKFNVAIYANKFDRQVLTTSRGGVGGGLATDVITDFGIDEYTYSLVGAYGITNWLEVGLTIPYKMNFASRPFEGSAIAMYEWADRSENRYNEAGFGDPLVSFKFRFFNSDKHRIALAAVIEGKAPLADSDTGLGTGELDAGLKLVFSKNWNRAGLHLSAGYSYIGDPENFDTKDSVDLNNEIYGALGFDFCPFRAQNFKLILEFEYKSNTYDRDEKLFDRYMADQLNAILGFRYFFTPKAWSLDQRMTKYSWAIGAGVRYALMEQMEDLPEFGVPNDEPSPWGFVAHVSFSPRLRSDICIIKPRKKGMQPPTVTVTADPATWTIEIDRIKANGDIEPKKGEDGNMVYVTSRIKALARDPDGDEKKIVYAWSYTVGDSNQVFQVLDGEGKPVATDEFDFTFTTPEPEKGTIPPYTFVCTVTDEQGLTATGKTTVTFAVTKPPTAMITLNPVLFAFDKPRKEGMGAITPEYKKQVDEEVIALMNQYDTILIRLEGLTCPIGTTEYNLALGERRAQAVYDYLTTLGISGIRLERVSYGEEERYLVVPCTVPNCIQQKDRLSPNRRTEFTITGGLPAGLNINPENLSDELREQRKENDKEGK